MPLARDQRERLARVLAWSRSHGWVHDAYPNTWRSVDAETHVRYDPAEETLVVSHLKPDQDPLRCHVALVPLTSVDVALDVLAALGHIPKSRPLEDLDACSCSDSTVADDATRVMYRALMVGGHAYMSTYCQHGLHDDCRRTCKCCDAPCVCSGCLHTESAPDNDFQARLDRDHAALGGHGDDPETFDGPASFLDAGQVFADLVDGRVEPGRAAEVLSALAVAGLIVSVGYHDEVTGELAGQGDLMDELAAIIAKDEQ